MTDLHARLHTAGPYAHLLAPFLGRHVLAAAAQMETTRRSGYVIGLTEADVTEVIQAWVLYYQSTPYPLPWDDVRGALAARSVGREWTPEEYGRYVRPVSPIDAAQIKAYGVSE